MTWMYRCADDRMTLTADSKEQLADKMVQHMQEAHNQTISRDQAMRMIDMQQHKAA